jgi:CheY-like chemotaxis protein
MREVSSNTILLVDDNPSIRDILSRRLQDEGFEAQQAEDGIDGLAKLRDKLPKVIVSDLQMPRMAGIEFISVVRRRFPSIPVIFLSGSVPGEFPVEAKPDGWFEKSADQIPRLLQAVKDLAQKTPEDASHPQVISTPVRTLWGGSGYSVLTCTDCLRLFQVARESKNKSVEQTAVCTHCEAHVPFLIESLEPA